MLEKLGKLLVSIRDLAGFTIDLDHGGSTGVPEQIRSHLGRVAGRHGAPSAGRENPVATSYEHVENI